MKKIIRLTETQLIKRIEKLLKEATPEGNTNSRMASLKQGFTEKIGSSLFKNGIDSIDTKNPQFLTLVQKLKNIPSNYNVFIEGGASAVGSSTGYDNMSLAKRRSSNFINALKKFNVNTNNIKLSTPVVGKSTIKNSPEAEAEQYVKITVIKPNKIESAIDNTAVKKPQEKIGNMQYQKTKTIRIPENSYDKIIEILRKNGFNIK